MPSQTDINRVNEKFRNAAAKDLAIDPGQVVLPGTAAAKIMLGAGATDEQFVSVELAWVHYATNGGSTNRAFAHDRGTIPADCFRKGIPLFDPDAGENPDSEPRDTSHPEVRELAARVADLTSRNSYFAQAAKNAEESLATANGLLDEAIPLLSAKDGSSGAALRQKIADYRKVTLDGGPARTT